MGETKKAAPEEQPYMGSANPIITQTVRGSLNTVASMFGGEAAFIKLRGYSSANKETDPNKRYSTAKVPIDKDWTSPNFSGHSISDLTSWIERGGWVGLRIPADHIVVDVDDVIEGRAIKDLMEQQNIRHHLMRTPNGYQFILKDTGAIEKQNVKMFTECGFAVDYRLQHRGQIVIPTPNTEGREWLKVVDSELSDMPYWFEPIKQINNKNERPFTVPITEGSRNTTLFQHACRLKKMARSEDRIANVVEFIGTYLCSPSVDLNEIETIIDSALKYQDQVIDTKKRGAKIIEHPAISKAHLHTPHAEKVKFSNTDLGNSKRLIYRHGDDLRYCYTFGTWYVWDDKRWRTDDTGEVERRAKETVLSIYQEAMEAPDEQRVALMKHATASESYQKVRNMISFAQSEEGVPVTPAQLDGDQWKLNCLNGVIDLRTGKLLTHDKNELMTNIVSTNYDPEADCPTWKTFLNRIMQDANGNVREELVHFLQKAVGYALTGDISEQVTFFLYGSGKNGKSTFINVIKDLLGDYAKQSGTETFMMKQQTGGVPNDLARLKGARLISAVESEEGKRLAESLIKQLTGGEPITARFLHKEFFEFIPTFKLFFVTNHKPQIKGTDPAIWRRIRLIPFTVTISPDEDDKALPEKLRKEMPGILKWAVDGCLLWQKERLGAPDEVVNATSSYQEEMDTLSHFVNEHCIVNPAAKASTKDLYAAYKEWCEENGEYTQTKNKFIQRLRERMESHGHTINDYRTNSGRGWTGIGVVGKTDLPNISDASDTQNELIRKFISTDKNQENSVTSVTSVTQQEAAAAQLKAWEEGEL